MGTFDLTKGSGKLYGESDKLGRIQTTNQGNTIKKSDKDGDDLKK